MLRCFLRLWEERRQFFQNLAAFAIGWVQANNQWRESWAAKLGRHVPLLAVDNQFGDYFSGDVIMENKYKKRKNQDLTLKVKTSIKAGSCTGYMPAKFCKDNPGDKGYWKPYVVGED
ncbi:MAG: hypothetical protein NTZ74_14620 [Chloroflexi bacterium]|nr:hypothetical protein [Chloroflexota bacterium]